MNLAALFSGGKDSTYAIYIAQQSAWNVKYLVSIMPEEHSFMFHYPNIELTKLMSEALGIIQIIETSKKGEEAELQALKSALDKLKDVDGVVTGAIASDYQGSRINRICQQLGLKTLSPLWRKDGEMLLRDMMNAGFEIIIVGVYAEGFDQSWLGRKLTPETLQELLHLCEKYRVNPSGEGGEFETLVLDGPNFKKRLTIDGTSTRWEKDSGAFIVEKAHLEDKEK